jgi:Flp pilus assembly pilin Flp
MNILALFSQLNTALNSKIVEPLKNQNGQTMVEYVMLIVLVALAIFLLSPDIVSPILAVFQNTSSALA